jgi:predicted nucleotidyltransferase component of viral defense system
MNTISKCGVRFFLTGGTALSRAYYNHRYSASLDFFLNDDNDYPAQVKEVLYKLKEEGFFWDPLIDFISDKNFTSIKVGWNKSDTLIKIDFVNDAKLHFGDIVKTELFIRIDSIRNMLSNKLTALLRFDGKDVADIREIALHEKVDWHQSINDARQKEADLEIPIICDILQKMSQNEFETVAWTKKPDWQEFRNDIDHIVQAMISGESL